jgi:glutaredoxin
MAKGMTKLPNGVNVFSAEWCVGCKTLKKTLQANDVSYNEIDVDTEDGMALAAEYSVRSLPMTFYVKNENVEGVFIGVINRQDDIQLLKGVG